MKILKTLGAFAFATVMAFGMSAPAQADESFPDRPITVIITFAPGGVADILTRLTVARLEKELGVPFKVVSAPGGGHVPGIMKFLGAPADGYTLIRWNTPATIINPLTRELPYDPSSEFTPLFMDATASNVLYVKADSPYQNLDDVINAMKENSLVVGVNNVGAPPHLSAVQLGQQFGVEFKTLTLKTIPKTMAALIGGQVDIGIGQLGQNLQYEGEIRPIAILDDRYDHFDDYVPGVPTVAEAAPGKVSRTWINSGFAVKAGTPPEIVEKLAAAADRALNNEEYKEELNKYTTYRWVGGAEAVKAEWQVGTDTYKPLLDDLGLLKK